jgi:hypothetical protein
MLGVWTVVEEESAVRIPGRKSQQDSPTRGVAGVSA